MARPTPPVPPMELKARTDHGMIVEKRSYELITPLFGGGVEPNTPDPVTTIRATEIRGHLRFWWRATRGGQFKTIEELKEAEDIIWGAASKKGYERPSLVSIEVLEPSKGQPDIPFVVEGSKQKPKVVSRPYTKIPEYVAFPLQPPKAEQVPGMEISPVYTHVAFTMKIMYPQNQKLEIEAALWAWETFGGIGARTRRGFGALKLTKVNNQIIINDHILDKNSLKEWIETHLNIFIESENWPEGIPHLSKKLNYTFLVGLPSDSYKIWQNLVNKLKKFRQYRINRETRNYDKYGHNDWPEPNTIRAAFKKLPKGPHADRKIRKFPRAQFGLPIVFHMPHDGNLSTTLEGERKSRLASPLILKPIALKTDVVGLAVILEGTNLPLPLTLKNQSPSDDFQVDPTLNASEAKNIIPLNGEVNVLKAFLAYVEQK